MIGSIFSRNNISYRLVSFLKADRLWPTLSLVGIFCLAVIVFSQQIDLNASDIGRHIANGRSLFSDRSVLFSNFYSFTEPEAPFINHHWLYGLFSFFIYRLGGFTLLSIINLLLGLAVFYLCFSLMKRRAGWTIASWLSLPLVFMLSERAEVRPEIFSYLFIFLTWLILESARTRPRLAWWLLPLFVLWANLHIYFVLGLALIGIWAASAVLEKFFSVSGNIKGRWLMTWQSSRFWFVIFGASVLACLASPNTWRGLLYPLRILSNYGYQVAENKSIFFLDGLMADGNFLLFKLWIILLIVSLAAGFFFSRRWHFFDGFVAVLAIGLGFSAVRNLSLAALLAGPVIAGQMAAPLNYLIEKWPLRQKWRTLGSGIFIVLVAASGLYLAADAFGHGRFLKQPLGWGLRPGSLAAAEFFKAEALGGPIFNNYDIGSSLIFSLFPQEKIFVDNRPEAYSQEFFSQTYIPMQTDSASWKTAQEIYGFKLIFFGHGDSTPWARQFISRILADDNYQLVYFDAHSFIMLFKDAWSEEKTSYLAINQAEMRQKLRELAFAASERDKFSLARFALVSGQDDIAEEISKGILFKQPRRGKVLAFLGDIYAGRGNWALAAANYLKAAEAGYGLPPIYTQLGLAYWNLGRYDLAEDSWRAARRQSLGYAPAADYLKQLKELEEQGKIR